MADREVLPTMSAKAGQGDHHDLSSQPSISWEVTQGSKSDLAEKYEEPPPTASHALADEATRAESEYKGASQVEHGNVEVKNLGWNHENVPRHLVGGLENEELWTMVRRFNKQVLHVKSIDKPPLANLDFEIADHEEFSPEKLRAQLERLYMVVLVSLFSVWVHVVRLRSWREWQRTSAFMAAYSVAWLLDLLMPAIIAFLIILVLLPPARHKCFPPAPLSLIHYKTGGIRKPPAGVLASDDSVTGAPEKHKGEAVEQEAHSFVTSIATVCSGIVISTAAGRHPVSDPYEDNSAPDPAEVTANVAHARDKTGGGDPTVEHDMTKEPVSRAVWNQARPVMHALADFVDTWERFGNALSPTLPFPLLPPRLRIAGCLFPLLVGSYMTTSYVMLKSLGFVIGFALFGNPIITRGVAFLDQNFPGWNTYIELRHNILRGIPTNVQLVITLLRIGEKNRAPLPPPPLSDIPPSMKPHATAGQGLDHLDATEEEIEDAVQPDPEDMTKEDSQRKPKKTKRIMNLLKGAAKSGIQTAIAADKARATIGAKHAKNRLDVVKGDASWPSRGPVTFPARFKGKKGHVYILTTATMPAVGWTSSLEDMHPAWTVTIGGISDLKKVGGLGWKSKIVVGWALGSEIKDGLVIKTKQGDELHLTAIATRDDLFNRLIAMGSQMWMIW